MNHQCEEMEREITRRAQPIELKKYAEGWLLDMVSTDDTYISADATIGFCPFCGVKLE